jgi:hypothetical protein
MPIQPTQPARSSTRNATHQLTAVVLVAMLWHPAGASTEDPTTSMFSFSGFGTLGVVHSSEDDADFTSSRLKPNGAGYTRAWSPAVDSTAGAQVTANFTPQLSAVLQIIAEQNYDNTYIPHVEWANIKYQFTPEVSVRVGRIVLPVFLVSDSRMVGYANPWVRPPVEVYDFVPVSDSDGADASYRINVGDFVNTVMGTYGRNSSRAPEGGNVIGRREWVVSDTVEYGAVTIHLAYEETHLTIDSLNALFAAFRQYGAQGNALADRYDVDDKPFRFIGLGGMYDPGAWFVTGEWGATQFHSVVGDGTAWYVSGGYRLAKFTPYLSYAQVKADSNTFDPGLTVSALPPSLAAPAVGLNTELNSILGSIAVQKTISVGARWDFLKNVDLKLQYDRTRLGAGSPGTLINLQPDFRPGVGVNLFSIAIDFVL